MNSDQRLKALEARLAEFMAQTQQSFLILQQRLASMDQSNPSSPAGSTQEQVVETDILNEPTKLQVSEVTTQWFTKRSFPEFTVNIVDAAGRSVDTPAGWMVCVHLIGSDGNSLDELLSPRPPVFSVEHGRAVVGGFKILSVSCRHGGDFRLEIRAIAPQGQSCRVQPFRSAQIRVISERLFLESKANAISDMNPDDSIKHIPGIGKKYSDRLVALGLCTVKDLAALATPEAGTKSAAKLNELLETIRKHRGTLSQHRLGEIIRECRSVVLRDTSNKNPDSLSDSGSSVGFKRGRPQPSVPMPAPPMVSTTGSASISPSGSVLSVISPPDSEEDRPAVIQEAGEVEAAVLDMHGLDFVSDETFMCDAMNGSYLWGSPFAILPEENDPISKRLRMTC